MKPPTPSKDDKSSLTITQPDGIAKDSDTVYRPMILRFRCIGEFSLTPPSATDKAKNKRGTLQACRGIKSDLLPLGEYPPMQASQALQTFIHSNSNLHPHVAGFGGVGQNSGERKMQSSEESEDELQRLPHVIDPKLFELQSHLEEESNNNATTSPASTPLTILPPLSSLNFYGSTQVGVLLLRPIPNVDLPQNKLQSLPNFSQDLKSKDIEKVLSESIVYALAPENTFGVSVREMNNQEKRGSRHISGGTWSTLKIGVLEVSLASRHEGMIEEEEEKEWNNQDKDKMDPDTQRGDFSENFSKRAEDYYDQFSTMGRKMGNSMYHNAKFITNELQDDFIPRTLQSGEKIINNFGKTSERMKNLAKNIYDFWNNDGDD